MSHPTPREAVSDHTDRLQLALACVARSNVLLVDGVAPGARRNLFLPGGGPLTMNGPGGYRLEFEERFDLIEASGSPRRERWTLQVAEYAYAIRDNTGRRLIAYHLHPSAAPVIWPHLHLGPAAGDMIRAIASAHLPTSKVEPEQVLFLAIRELGVEPLRDDWAAVLAPTPP